MNSVQRGTDVDDLKLYTGWKVTLEDLFMFEKLSQHMDKVYLQR